MSIRSIVSLGLIALAFTTDAYKFETLRYCIRVDGVALCPGNVIQVGSRIQIQSGFAPGSGKIEKLRPKWDDTFHARFDDPGGNFVLQFGHDYCLNHKTIDGWAPHGCAQKCYLGDQVANPYYDTTWGGPRPITSDPIAGQVNRWGHSQVSNDCQNPNSPGMAASTPLVQEQILGESAFNDPVVDTIATYENNADAYSFNILGGNDNQPLIPAPSFDSTAAVENAFAIPQPGENGDTGSSEWGTWTGK